jgi:hypothetical protein
MATTTTQQKNTHFILLIHCIAHLPFDDCIYSPQHDALGGPGGPIEGEIADTMPTLTSNDSLFIFHSLGLGL